MGYFPMPVQDFQKEGKTQSFFSSQAPADSESIITFYPGLGNREGKAAGQPAARRKEVTGASSDIR